VLTVRTVTPSADAPSRRARSSRTCRCWPAGSATTSGPNGVPNNAAVTSSAEPQTASSGTASTLTSRSPAARNSSVSGEHRAADVAGHHPAAGTRRRGRPPRDRRQPAGHVEHVIPWPDPRPGEQLGRPRLEQQANFPSAGVPLTFIRNDLVVPPC
jgi:hypothetical protein